MIKSEKQRAIDHAKRDDANMQPEKNWQDKRNIKGEKKAQDNGKLSVNAAAGIDRVKQRPGDLKKGQGGKMSGRVR